MPQDLKEIIKEKFKLRADHVENIIGYYDDKATIPFVSRYRKDQTGNLDEVQISSIYDSIKYYNDLFARKVFIIDEIEKKGKMTDELRKKLEECLDAKKLEDIYLPYKEKKKTKAEKAREAGIEPLADFLLSFQNLGDPLIKATQLINAEKGYDTELKVIEGAYYIIAQRVIEKTDLMETFLKNAFLNGTMTSKKKKGYEGDDNRFEDYYEYNEDLSHLRIPKNSHRFLAISRGLNLNILSIKLEVEDDVNIHELKACFIKKEHFYKEHIIKAVEIAYREYIHPALDTRIMSELTENAETEAIKVFTRNLESLLMSPPIPYTNVLGLDPGIRTGIKTAVLDKDGTYKAHCVLYINSLQEIKKSGETLFALITKYDIGAISIGNGTGSRETLAFVKNLIKEKGLKPVVAIVDESGASVYSASEIAREEFPDLDVTVRGAISIGRRLQNPLAEIVKIDPKSIGVGQYQHDVDQKHLKEALERVIQICVNNVGIDINTSSYAILTYISGLSEKISKNIIDYRKKNGFLKNRKELLEIKGIGPKVFEQCAGFLMIRKGDNPLDGTRVHPESYPIIKRIAESNKLDMGNLIGNKAVLGSLNSSDYLNETYQIHNFKSLLDELANPLQDPRKEYRNISYKDGIEKIEDVKEGMTFEGRVTNVTNFGAFIDIGVHQDGLCHISQLASDRFVKEPGEIVSVGDIVSVSVTGVDRQKKRISLKMFGNLSRK